MKTKKIFSLIAALLAMLMVLSACGAASSTPSTTQAASQSTDTQSAATTEKAADPVTITYCNFNSSGGNEETLAKMVEAFEAAHTDIKVEVETTTLEEVQQAIDAGADIIMLDNMSNETMAEAVKLIAGRAKTEASGNMSIPRLQGVAATGVDYISVGALTHSVTALDISMNIKMN